MTKSRIFNRLLAFGTTLGLALLCAFGLSADVVIPSSAFVTGGGGSAEFHSDVRVFNPTQTPVTVVPVFYDQASGQTFTAAAVSIGARTQQAFDNILSTVFGRPLGVFGPIRFQTTAPIIVSSSVNNVKACQGGGSGQWLSGIDVGQARTAGTLVQLASSVDTASGYRTNIVFMNPGTGNANVTVRVRKGDGTQLSQNAAPISLVPNGFIQINNFGDTLPGVAGTADANLWAEFTSDSPVLAFASVINNVSGDPYAILATAEPGTGGGGVAPVAGYSVSPAQPKPGETVTFTDTSSNNPTTQLWSFGDGTILTSGATAAHAYAAAGTYHSSHFVANAAGAAGLAKDVPVSAPAQPVNITASQWKYSPDPVTLNVGTTYVISWQSADVFHGVGGIADLGIVQCDLVSKTAPCTVTFTPTASMVGSHPYMCTQSSCGAGHPTMKGTIIVR